MRRERRFLQIFKLIFILYFRLPFNWKTPLGYSIAFCAQSVTVFYTCFSVSSVVSFLIGSCWMLTTIVEDIANDFSFLNERQSQDEKRKSIKRHFLNIVQLYSDANQLSLSRKPIQCSNKNNMNFALDSSK